MARRDKDPTKAKQAADDDLASAFDDSGGSDGSDGSDGTAASETTTASGTTTAPSDHGFTFETREGGVVGRFSNEFTAPRRDDVHITAGPNDTTGDSDHDGLSDAAEAVYGTSPTDYDSDRDGLPDGVEVQMGTDPTDRLGDADHDGVPDATEVGAGMNPFDPDTDHDGIGDAVEYDRYPFLAIVPTPGSTDEDWDGDGIPNDTEVMYGNNPAIPESSIPELKAVRDREYELRLQLQADPVQQAIIASDLRRDLTPEQESALLDAVFERGIESTDPFGRFALASQLNAIDGTPIPPELQAEYDAAVAARDAEIAQRLPGMGFTEVLGVQRQIQLGGLGATLEGLADARLAEIGGLADQVLTTGDAGALVQLRAALPGVDLTPQVIEQVSTFSGSGGASTGDTSGSDATSGTQPVNLAEAALDRMGDGFATVTSPSSPSSPSSPAAGPGDDVSPAPSPTEPGGPVEFNPDDTATRAADNLADWADGIAGRIGATGSGGDGSTPGLSTGTTQGPAQEHPDAIVELGEIDDAESAGLSTRGTTEEGRGYTEYNWGGEGTQRVYDDGHYQWYNPDGSPRGGEVDTTSSDAGDGSNPYDGTTDDDEEDPDDTDDDGTFDDGDSGTATAYVNPDADPITLVLSPVVAQAVLTGVDPTTTTPSGPYVDDSPTPIVVSSGTIDLGLGVPLHPGVIDGNPDVLESVFDSPPTGLDPLGPDTIDPNDPIIDLGGEDIDLDSFTPRPSVADTGLMGEGPPDDGFDPDPFD